MPPVPGVSSSCIPGWITLRTGGRASILIQLLAYCDGKIRYYMVAGKLSDFLT